MKQENKYLEELKQTDCSSIIEILNPVVSFYSTNRFIKKYKLYRQLNLKNIDIISLSDSSKKIFNVNVRNLASNNFKDAVIFFTEVIMNKFSSTILDNFYKNLCDLKIHPRHFKLKNSIFKTHIVGIYKIKENIIEIDYNDVTSSIYHELFHMASSIYRDGVEKSGFIQISKNPYFLNLGYGITEGYTELLTRRYFGYYSSSYEYEVNVSEKLEIIVGKSKMESLYLTANLLGLIDELKKYISESRIRDFIFKVDFLNTHLRDKNLKTHEKEIIIFELKSVNDFLLQAYTSKLKKQYNLKEINENELCENLISYLKSLPNNLEIAGYEYKIPYDVNSIQEILKKEDIIIELKDADQHHFKSR